MLEHVIPLISSVLPLWREYLIFVFALSFLSFVPVLIRSFLRG